MRNIAVRNRSVVAMVNCSMQFCGGQVKVKATDYPAENATPPESEIVVLEPCTLCGAGAGSFSEDAEADMWYEALHRSYEALHPTEDCEPSEAELERYNQSGRDHVPFEQTSHYRESMQDSGRGHLLS